MPNTTVLTPEGRVRFAHLLKAVKNYNGDGMERSVTLLFPKNQDLSILENAYKGACMEEWNNVPNSARKFKGLSSEKAILKDGDQYFSTRDEEKQAMYEAYKGCWFMGLTASESQNLPFMDENRDDIVTQDVVYDGCYGRALVEFSAYENKFGKQVSCKFLAFQKVRDGEPIEGGSSGVSNDTARDAFGLASATPANEGGVGSIL